MRYVSTAELLITVDSIKIPIVAKKLFYGEFMWPAAITRA